MNIQKQNPTYKELAINLQSYLEKEESKKLECKFTYQKCEWDIHPVNPKGDCTEASAQPTIIYTIDNTNKVFNINSIFLLNQNRGIGSILIKTIIQFCKNNGINKIHINTVDNRNEKMIGLCKKFNFTIYKQMGEYNSWELSL